LSSPDLWVDAETDTVWECGSDGGFRLVECRGQVPASVWSPVEIARALQCPSSQAKEDGAGVIPVFFPPSFLHSPNTGAPLSVAPARPLQTWLPPNGAQQVTDRLLRGAKLTPFDLRLVESPEWPMEPQEQIPLPPPGGHKFLVAPCGFAESFLFVLDPSHGCLYCWVPSAKRWEDINPASSDGCGLDSNHVPLAGWWPECEDLKAGAPLLWPSDVGILAVHINPLSLTYTTDVLAEGVCVSSLVLTGDKVCGIFA